MYTTTPKSSSSLNVHRGKSGTSTISSQASRRSGPGFFRRMFSKESREKIKTSSGAGAVSSATHRLSRRIVHSSASSPAIVRRLEAQTSVPKFQPLTLEFDDSGAISSLVEQDETFSNKENDPSIKPPPKQRQVPRKPVGQGNALTGPVLTYFPRTGRNTNSGNTSPGPLRRSVSQVIKHSVSLNERDEEIIQEQNVELKSQLRDETIITDKQPTDVSEPPNSNYAYDKANSDNINTSFHLDKRMSKISNFDEARYMADIIRINSRDDILSLAKSGPSTHLPNGDGPTLPSSSPNIDLIPAETTHVSDQSDSDCVIVEVNNVDNSPSIRSQAEDLTFVSCQDPEEKEELMQVAQLASLPLEEVPQDISISAEQSQGIPISVDAVQKILPADALLSLANVKNESADTLTSSASSEVLSSPYMSSEKPLPIPEKQEHDEFEAPDSVALQLFNNSATFIKEDEYARWLGSEGMEQSATRGSYMKLFDFTNKSILTCLRTLCNKIYMKGESQHLHRVIEAFSSSWCAQNPGHGFYDPNVVYTITYALVLLNTDLYGADHTDTKKMSRNTFVQNTLETVKILCPDSIPSDAVSTSSRSQRISIDAKRSSLLGTPSSLNLSTPNSSTDLDTLSLVDEAPFAAFTKEWEFLLETILRIFYTSLSRNQLQLHMLASTPFSSASTFGTGDSNSPASLETSKYINTSSTSTIDALSRNVGLGLESSSPSVFAKMSARLRSHRSQQYENQSRIPIGRNLNANLAIDSHAANMRKDSLSSAFSIDSGLTSTFGLGRHATGFAGLLWNQLSHEGHEETSKPHSDVFSNFTEIQNELSKEVELELRGAPWAKEGILMYRPYIDPSTGKKPRKKDWVKVFAVVQRGQIRMYDLDVSSSSSATVTSGGDGNWLDKAKVVDGFHLCHTLCQELPALKRRQGFSALWSLQLPQKGLLVFKAGTSDIAKEFVYTCNYWASRLSKEPLEESITSFEYGWTVNLDVPQDNDAMSGSSSRVGSSRKYNMPGDKLTIKEWRPTGHSMVVSDLNEDVQMTSLKNYVLRADTELETHASLRKRLGISFSPGTNNYTRAHNNWERKSQYLTQQSVRYKIYVETLEKAVDDKVTAEAEITAAVSRISTYTTEHRQNVDSSAVEDTRQTATSAVEGILGVNAQEEDSDGSHYSQNTHDLGEDDTVQAVNINRTANPRSCQKLDEDESDYHSLDTNSLTNGHQ